MLFGKPTKIPNYEYTTAFVKHACGWGLFYEGCQYPVKIGNNMWFRTLQEAKLALDPIRFTHVPSESDTIGFLEMKLRPSIDSKITS